jgi:sporulation protein YlmC with PRC-barrel domain
MTASINEPRKDMVAPRLHERPGEAEAEEVSDFISSSLVEDTEVFRPTGEKIGRVEYLVIEKATGQVRVVVMSFGGFLGLGKEHRPVPWEALGYNTTLDGYVLNADDDVLKNSPVIDEGKEIEWDIPYRQTIFSHWGF